MTFRRRIVCIAFTIFAIVLILFIVYCFTPFSVYTLGIELRAPWIPKSEWHLTRYDWFIQEPGYEHIVNKHRRALIKMELNAVPVLLHQSSNGIDKHARERAVLLLKEIGDKAHSIVLGATRRAKHDERGRLLYVLFVAFEDWTAFSQWLEYAMERGSFALNDNYSEQHIQQFWNNKMPPYAVASDGESVINPEFVKWWKIHRE